MPKVKDIAEESAEPVVATVEKKTKTVEEHALGAGIGPGSKAHWQFAAAQAMHRWPQGKELTAEEFGAAVIAATTASIQ